MKNWGQVLRKPGEMHLAERASERGNRPWAASGVPWERCNHRASPGSDSGFARASSGSNSGFGIQNLGPAGHRGLTINFSRNRDTDSGILLGVQSQLNNSAATTTVALASSIAVAAEHSGPYRKPADNRNLVKRSQCGVHGRHRP